MATIITSEDMFKNVTLFIVWAINRLMLLKGKFKLTDTKNQKNALVSYVLVPPFNLQFYFKTSHNNAYQCYLLVRYLRKQGYNVYLHYYLDEKIDYSVKFDLFIGHNKTFVPIAKRLKGQFKTLLLATGSHPQFGNDQQRIRILDVNHRKNGNLSVHSDNIVPDLSGAYNLADAVAMLGNEFVKHTYPKEYHDKIHLIDNVTLHPYFPRNDSGRKNNFLFISSTGQVHRGLDLLLDVFSKLDNKLYVLSSFKNEKEFTALYNKELFHTPNIIPVGYTDLDSKRFRDILNEVDFTILPSCSEGQSSSIVNMLSYGLIPVIPENVGITDVGTIGVEIETIDMNGVEKAVQLAIGLSSDIYEKKKQLVKKQASLYTKEAFVEHYDRIIRDLTRH